jgi:hypothetical protein
VVTMGEWDKMGRFESPSGSADPTAGKVQPFPLPSMVRVGRTLPHLVCFLSKAP